LDTLRIEIEKHIKKCVYPLKEKEALREALKLKLTKKEFKLLKAWAENTPAHTLQETLNIDKERYDVLSSKLIKKLNQEKIKQAICI